VYAVDLHGRGLSDGERFYVGTFADYVNDAGSLVNLVKSREPGFPVFLLAIARAAWSHASSLDNIWPQCGPPGVPLAQRYFKQKDIVENYLAWRVRHGEMNLGQAQRGIATDWTQYLAVAKQHCRSERCQKFLAEPTQPQPSEA
jgi:hypothetical protein